MRTPRLSLLLVALAAGAAACKPKQAPQPPPPAPPPPAAGPPADPADAMVAKVGALLGCMNRDLRAQRDAGDPELAGYGRTSATDAFVFDWMISEPARLAQEDASLCAAIKTDWRLFVAAMAQRPKGPARGLPPPVAEADPAFVRAWKGPTAVATLEHAELTAEVLPELHGGKRYPIFELVARASSAADVYRWRDTRYHALNESYEAGRREGDDAVNQDSFAALAVQHLWHLKLAMERHTYEIAAGDLGALCHMAADLALHRGITRRQLAGLTFFAGKPPRLSDPAIRAEAKLWLKEIVKLARLLVDDEASWRRFTSWSPAAGLDVERGLMVAFQADRDSARLTYVDLARFYASQLPFGSSKELRAELGDGPDGIRHWDGRALFDRIRTKLDNGGFTPRRPKVATSGAR